MASHRALTVSLAAVALGAAVAVGFFVLGDGDEPLPDGPPVLPVRPFPVPDSSGPRDLSGVPGTGAGDSDPDDGEDDLRDITGPEGGATAEEILAAFDRIGKDPHAWREIERLLRISGTDDPRVTAKILEFLRDDIHRNMAAEVAKYLKDPNAAEAFLALARDDKADSGTRTFALIASSNLGDPQVEAVAKDILRTAKPGSMLFGAAAGALAKVDTPAATQALVDMLRGGMDPGRRPMLIEALGRTRNPEVLRELARIATEDGDPAMRRAIVEALGRTRDPAVVDDLLRIARESEDAAVRSAAYAALGMVGDARSVEELLNVLQGGDNAAKLEAAQALGSLGMAGGAPAALPALEAALDTSIDETLLPYVLDALGRLRSPSSVGPLSGILADDSRPERIRLTAARAMGHIADPSATPALLEALEDAPSSSTAYRNALLLALARTARKEDLPRMQDLFAATKPQSSEHYLLRDIVARLEKGK